MRTPCYIGFAFSSLSDMGLVHFAPANPSSKDWMPSQLQLKGNTKEVPELHLLCIVPITTSYEALRGRSKGRTGPIYTERLLVRLFMLRGTLFAVVSCRWLAVVDYPHPCNLPSFVRYCYYPSLQPLLPALNPHLGVSKSRAFPTLVLIPVDGGCEIKT